MINKLLTCIICLVLIGCSAVKVVEPNRYTLKGGANKLLVKHASMHTVFVSSVNASSGYDTKEIIYTKFPLQLNSFVKSEWVAPPAKMLRSVIVSSLQNTGYFRAVVSQLFDISTHFQVDVSVLALRQSFIRQPSQVLFSIKADVIDTQHFKVIASKRFTEKRNARMDTPYAGVIAANQASSALMERLSAFVVKTCQNS